jgi:hypothetical protein
VGHDGGMYETEEASQLALSYEKDLLYIGGFNCNLSVWTILKRKTAQASG